jgi:DNA repair protein RadC
LPHGSQTPEQRFRRLSCCRSYTRLTEAATLLGLRILDHIIVTKKSHFSFQESGLLVS